MKPDLKALNPQELTSLMKEFGEPLFRAQQLARWMHKEGVANFADMSNLPSSLHGLLAERYSLAQSAIKRTATSPSDGATKHLLQLNDGDHIEMVFLPAEEHGTLCISTQVGCALGCSFCATAGMGFRRNLSAGEILDQLRLALGEHGQESIRNLVLMGMGEPLLNLSAVIPALGWARELFSIGRRHIAVSTVGIPEGMRRLAESGLGVRLALSLNAPSDELRSRLMPINRKHPIKEVLAELVEYSRITGERSTIEYVLLGGVNDRSQEAEGMLALTRTIPCKINLIAYNPCPGLPFNQPTKDTIDAFFQTLLAGPNTVTVRQSRGADIFGACGQLSARTTG